MRKLPVCPRLNVSEWAAFLLFGAVSLGALVYGFCELHHFSAAVQLTKQCGRSSPNRLPEPGAKGVRAERCMKIKNKVIVLADRVARGARDAGNKSENIEWSLREFGKRKVELNFHESIVCRFDY